MIKIEPDDIEGTYLRLLSVRTDNQSLDNLERLLSNLSDEQLSKTKTRIGGRSVTPKKFYSGSTPLENPLRSFSIIFYSDGVAYSGAMQVIFSAGVLEAEKNDKLVTKVLFTLKSRADVRLTENGAYFLHGSQSYFLLDTTTKNLNYISVSFGQLGTSKRRLSSLEVFETDMKKFGDVATTVVNAIYEKEPVDLTLKFYL